MSLWVIVTHFLTILLMTLLARSGVEILSAHPKLYASDDCPPGRALLRFSRKTFAPDSRRLWTSSDEEESWSPVVALPGRGHLGLGRHWHFLTVQFWVLTGLVYVALLFATGEWRRIVPQDLSIVPGAINAVGVYLQFRLPATGPYGYNDVQQLTYFLVIFVLAPLQIVTGAAMSPAVGGRFPRVARLFGGTQGARTLHFAGLCAFAAFVVVHTAMVLIHGLPRELAVIVLGSEHASHALAIAVAGVGLLLVAAVNVAATVGSLAHPRRTQLLLGWFVDPMERALSRRLRSRQRRSPGSISDYHRINGSPPRDATYAALAQDDFRGYRLEVGGLARHSGSFSLEELRELGWTSYIAEHHCIQGWTATAQWAGVPLAAILERVEPSPEARYVVFHAFDDKGETEPEQGDGHYYGSLRLPLARAPQTILALEMNGRALPIEHGAPARIRVENQLGFKMVKWVRTIELVTDLSAIGQGHGGWREDHQYYSSAAGI
jgi:sulfoxide reductase catalytic subunit YedY